MEDLYRLNSDRQIKQFWDELVGSSSIGGQHQSGNKALRGEENIIAEYWGEEQDREKQSCRMREGSKIPEKKDAEVIPGHGV